MTAALVCSGQKELSGASDGLFHDGEGTEGARGTMPPFAEWARRCRYTCQFGSQEFMPCITCERWGE